MYDLVLRQMTMILPRTRYKVDTFEEIHHLECQGSFTLFEVIWGHEHLLKFTLYEVILPLHTRYSLTLFYLVLPQKHLKSPESEWGVFEEIHHLEWTPQKHLKSPESEWGVFEEIHHLTKCIIACPQL